jgi:carbon storage regulator
MLVISRNVNEQIVIDGEIFITVLEVGRNGQVRLGITAPRHRQIYRHELWLEIEQENRDAIARVGSSAALNSLLDQRAEPARPAEPPASASK